MRVYQQLETRARAKLGPLHATWRCPELAAVAHNGGVFAAGIGIICLSETGRVQIHMAHNSVTFPFDNPDACSIKALTDLGAEVRAETCVSNSVDWGTSERVAYRSFLVLKVTIGASSTRIARQVRFLKNARVRLPRSVQLDCEVSFAPLRDATATVGALQSTLTVENPSAEADLSRTLDDVVRLLGVAFRARTQAPRVDSYCARAWLSTVLVPSDVDDDVTNDLIPFTGLATFLSHAFAGYRMNERDYSLNTAIFYYLRSHIEGTLEVKFIFASVLMEALKFYWAKNVAQLATRLNANGTIKEFTTPTGGKHGFKSLLMDMTKHLGLAATYTFTDDRNALFHTGLSAASQMGVPAAGSVLEAELRTLHDQIDDILLTLLTYQGAFYPFWNASVPLMFPGRARIPQG